jgi:hypothetical protein
MTKLAITAGALGLALQASASLVTFDDSGGSIATMNVEAQGYNGATKTYDNTYRVNATDGSLIAFNYKNTPVQFISSGGTRAGYGGPRYESVGSVPEPTTIISGVLMLLPFGASTLRILRRNRAA